MDSSYVTRWKDKECACGFEAFATDMIPCLGHVLPRQAAPFLSFDEASEPAYIWDVFGIPKDWASSDRQRLATYQLIGSDGGGNSICIEQGSGHIWLLDHEDRFHTKQFVNTSVGQLAECLLMYMGETDGLRFRNAVLGVDPNAIREGTFWWYESVDLDNTDDES